LLTHLAHVSRRLAPSRAISPHLATSRHLDILAYHLVSPDLGTSHVTPRVEKLLTHLADVSRRLATSRPSRHISHHLATSRHIWGDVDVGWLQLWLAENRDKKFIRAARIVLQHLLSRRSRPSHAASRAAPVTGAWVQRRKPHVDRVCDWREHSAKPPLLADFPLIDNGERGTSLTAHATSQPQCLRHARRQSTTSSHPRRPPPTQRMGCSKR